MQAMQSARSVRKIRRSPYSMQYRKFGRLDWDVSILGFGAMRLPARGDEKNIDEKEAARMTLIQYSMSS